MKYITKDLYVAFNECPKKFFMMKEEKEEKWELTSIIAKSDGEKVLKIAKELFPSGKDVEGDTIEEKIENTKQLIKEGYETLFGAYFLVDGDCLVQIDIFTKKEDKVWEIIEVKATSSSEMFDFVKSGSKKASIKSQLNDLAYQSFCMKKLGLTIVPSLINVNTRYKKMESLDLRKYLLKFTFEKQIKEFEIDVEDNIKKIKKVDEEPSVMVGSHCKNPYPCIFKNHCWDQLPDDTIHKIPRISTSKRKLFSDNNIESISQLKENDEMRNELTDGQKAVISGYLRGKIKKDIMKLTIFLNRIKYPIYYVDFETFPPIVPKYENSRPGENIPFQYSLHVEEKKGEFKHYEFLNTKNEDPRKEFIDSLIPKMGKEGSVIVYNRAFEEGVLDRLVELYPDHTESVQNIKNRVVDLWTPFKEGYYYDPKMLFSNSLKAVLPALAPHLNYNSLYISHGEEAMFMYEKMINMEDGPEKDKIIQGLLEYCKLDTWAMVEILNVLRKK